MEQQVAALEHAVEQAAAQAAQAVQTKLDCETTKTAQGLEAISRLEGQVKELESDVRAKEDGPQAKLAEENQILREEQTLFELKIAEWRDRALLVEQDRDAIAAECELLKQDPDANELAVAMSSETARYKELWRAAKEEVARLNRELLVAKQARSSSSNREDEHQRSELDAVQQEVTRLRQELTTVVADKKRAMQMVEALRQGSKQPGPDQPGAGSADQAAELARLQKEVVRLHQLVGEAKAASKEDKTDSLTEVAENALEEVAELRRTQRIRDAKIQALQEQLAGLEDSPELLSRKQGGPVPKLDLKLKPEPHSPQERAQTRSCETEAAELRVQLTRSRQEVTTLQETVRNLHSGQQAVIHRAGSQPGQATVLLQSKNKEQAVALAKLQQELEVKSKELVKLRQLCRDTGTKDREGIGSWAEVAENALDEVVELKRTLRDRDAQIGALQRTQHDSIERDGIAAGGDGASVLQRRLVETEKELQTKDQLISGLRRRLAEGTSPAGSSAADRKEVDRLQKELVRLHQVIGELQQDQQCTAVSYQSAQKQQVSVSQKLCTPNLHTPEKLTDESNKEVERLQKELVRLHQIVGETRASPQRKRQQTTPSQSPIGERNWQGVVAELEARLQDKEDELTNLRDDESVLMLQNRLVEMEKALQAKDQLVGGLRRRLEGGPSPAGSTAMEDLFGLQKEPVQLHQVDGAAVQKMMVPSGTTVEVEDRARDERAAQARAAAVARARADAEARANASAAAKARTEAAARLNVQPPVERKMLHSNAYVDQQFDKWDSNRDGVIDRTEFARMVTETRGECREIADTEAKTETERAAKPLPLHAEIAAAEAAKEAKAAAVAKARAELELSTAPQEIVLESTPKRARVPMVPSLDLGKLGARSSAQSTEVAAEKAVNAEASGPVASSKAPDSMFVIGYGAFLAKQNVEKVFNELRSFQVVEVHGWRRVFDHTSPQLFAHNFSSEDSDSQKNLQLGSLSMESAPGVVSTVTLLEVPSSDGLAFFQSKPEFSTAQVLLSLAACHDIADRWCPILVELPSLT